MYPNSSSQPQLPPSLISLARQPTTDISSTMMVRLLPLAVLLALACGALANLDATCLYEDSKKYGKSSSGMNLGGWPGLSRKGRRGACAPFGACPAARGPGKLTSSHYLHWAGQCVIS